MISALRGFGPLLQDSTPAPIPHNTMTALNIRKNLASILVNTAAAVENAKLPTKAGMTEKLNEYRTRAAALIMPNDMAFIIQPKQGN